MKVWIRWLAGVATAGALAVGLSAIKPEWNLSRLVSADTGDVAASPAAARELLPVETVAVQWQDRVLRRARFAGQVVPGRSLDASFQVGGIIEQILVDEGDFVSPHAKLARIDTRRLNNRRQQLVAEQAAAQAQWDDLQRGSREEDIAAARAQMAARAATLRQWEADERRLIPLHQQGVINTSQLDDVTARREEAASQWQAAQQQLAKLAAGPRAEELTAAAARVDLLTAQIAGIDIDLADSELTVPFAGCVSRRYVDEGTLVAAGTPILTVLEANRWEAHVGVPLEWARQLRVGDTCIVQVHTPPLSRSGPTAEQASDANETSDSAKMLAPNATGTSRDLSEPGTGDMLTRVTATILSVVPVVDQATRTQEVRLQLPPSGDHGWAQGTVVELLLQQEVAERGVWLPMSALFQAERGMWACFAVQPTAAGFAVERRLVEILRSEDGRHYVRGTLSEADQIAARGTHRLALGQAVQPIPVAPP